MEESVQSVLSPAGPVADSIASLAWLLFLVNALILLTIVALVAWAVLAAPERRRWLARESTVWIGGLVLPVATFTALGIHGIALARTSSERRALDLLVIEVVGEQWWWRVRYVDAEIFSANELHLPVGREVELRLKSADVIHSFWVPRLAGKLDMIPGRENRLRLRAAVPGVHRGQCAEYCGGAHARMAFLVVAETPDQFAAWLAREREPAAEPAGALAVRGREAFLAAGCGACHQVRGTPARGMIGPDLTHVGSRLSLAAGMLPNHTGTFAGWIASSQHLKPGTRMPAYEDFTGVELRAIATYLKSLD
jgi:cytochrome c oxidase subunit II